VSPRFGAVIPGQQSSSHRRCRWSSTSAFIWRDHARRPVDAYSQPSATVPSQWPHQGPGTVCLRQSGPRRPYQRFVMNRRHFFFAGVSMDININSFHSTFLCASTRILLTTYKVPSQHIRDGPCKWRRIRCLDYAITRIRGMKSWQPLFFHEAR